MKYFLIIIFSFYFGPVDGQIGTNPGGPPFSCDGWVYCDNAITLEENIENQDGNYKLVFYDEFEADLLDSNNWFTYYPYGENRDGTSEGDRVHGESQVYLDENVIVKDGFLHLLGKKENVTWFEKDYKWSSGLVNSKIPFTTYGKFEAFCKMPCGKGWFAAFWMFGWGTEIDVFETQGDDKIGVGTINWVDGRFPKGIDYEMDFCNEFHKYSVEYSPLTVDFYVDDVLIYTVYHYRNSKGCGISQYPIRAGTDVCTNLEFPRIGDPIDVIANLAVGGPFNKSWSDKQINPEKNGTMLVDWIRVFQKEIQSNLKSLCVSEIIESNDICTLEDSVQFCTLENLDDFKGIWSYSDDFEVIDVNEQCINLRPLKIGNVASVSLNILDHKKGCDSEIRKNVILGIPNPEIRILENGNCENLSYLISIEKRYEHIDFEWTILSNIDRKIISSATSIVWDVHPLEYELSIELEIANNCGQTKMNKKAKIQKCEDLMNICLVKPNPANNNFIFKINNFDESDKLLRLEIFSIDGVRLFNLLEMDSFNGELLIDSSIYSSGTYIIKGILNNYEISKFFVIIKG